MILNQYFIINCPFKFRVSCQCKYNFSEDGKKVTPRRDVSNYPKVRALHSNTCRESLFRF